MFAGSSFISRSLVFGLSVVLVLSFIQIDFGHSMALGLSLIFYSHVQKLGQNFGKFNYSGNFVHCQQLTSLHFNLSYKT
jgi:hypothetical protein